MSPTEKSTWLNSAAVEVFETMCFMEVLGPLEEEIDSEAEWLTATLSFQGNRSGKFGICTPYPVAQSMAANLLGEEATDIDRQSASDVMSEIANMVCGGLIQRLGRESVYDLSHPVCVASLALPESNVVIERVQLDSGPVCLWVDTE